MQNNVINKIQAKHKVETIFFGIFSKLSEIDLTSYEGKLLKTKAGYNSTYSKKLIERAEKVVQNKMKSYENWSLYRLSIQFPMFGNGVICWNLSIRYDGLKERFGYEDAHSPCIGEVESRHLVEAYKWNAIEVADLEPAIELKKKELHLEEELCKVRSNLPPFARD